MGCDIHLKTFVYSKPEKKMIPLAAAVPDGCSFPAIVGERDYDLFGLFGNFCRSWYPQLDCFESEEFPDFMKKTALFKHENTSDSHTRRWCYADKLEASLLAYRESLLDPKKWLKLHGGDDLFARNAARKKGGKKKWMEFHKGLVLSIDATMEKIRETRDVVREREDALDPEKIAFVTWMDN